MKFREHWSSEMKEAWDKSPDTHRFNYQTNRVVMGLFIGQLFVLWSFFIFTSFAVETWNHQLTAFLIVYGSLSFFMLANLMKWRTFVLLSAVVFTHDTLYWVQGREEFSAKRSTLDAEKMGLTRADTWNRFEASLRIKDKQGSESLLFIYRPYAYLDNLEGLMERLLEKISRDSKKRKNR